LSIEQIPPRKTNGFAIAALVNGLVGITFFWTVFLGVCSVLGIVFGHVSLSQLKVSGHEGRGMAMAGLVLGYVSLGFWALILLIAGIVAAA
jgi:hypothetical protein